MPKAAGGPQSDKSKRLLAIPLGRITNSLGMRTTDVNAPSDRAVERGDPRPRWVAILSVAILHQTVLGASLARERDPLRRRILLSGNTGQFYWALTTSRPCR
jgi:hypothetical protein